MYLMLLGLLLILITGFIFGELADRLGLPKLIGMLLCGIIIGPYVLDLLPEVMLELSDEIRMLALLVILFKAGLGLDKNKILAQGSVAIRLGFLPAVIEASVVAVATHYIFGWDWLTSWLLGWIICAASPAVIVPLMLRLKAEGWGVKKGIPDLILAGGTASDATAITMFGIFLVWVSENGAGNIWYQLTDIPLQISLGIIFGLLAGVIAVYIIIKSNLTGHVVQDLIVALGLGLFLVIGDEYVPYSSFLAVMVMGFYILERSPVSARKIRKELDKIWIVGQIFLFVLIGAAVNIGVIFDAGLRGLAIIGIGLLVGRWLGIFTSTWGSDITIPERMFMVVGDMAKATVQAAIGGIPLAMGVTHGEEILAVAVLSILVTAPLGAFGTMFLAPRILERGKVDPTKVNIQEDFILLVAFDGSHASWAAFLEATRAARQLEAQIILMHVIKEEQENTLSKDQLKKVASEIASDVEVKIKIREGVPSKQILEVAEEYQVDYIYLGKHNHPVYEKVLVGETSQNVIQNAFVPVILIEKENGKSNSHSRLSMGAASIKKQE